MRGAACTGSLVLVLFPCFAALALAGTASVAERPRPARRALPDEDPDRVASPMFSGGMRWRGRFIETAWMT
ncbi:MAG: hypothetical protein FJ291_07405 [Planctomycetes bacterium]|nr:hypothetical protein [Planctomycetota bacterium]